MNPFDPRSIPRIVFGPGVFSRIGELARRFGMTALVIHNGDDVEAIARLRSSLSTAGVACELIRQHGEPQVAHVDAAVATGRAMKCDVVVGLGGGSAIDAAKAVAGLLTNGGVATDYMEVVGLGKRITQPPLPWIAVPTTAGTGAEVTRNAVIGLPEKQFKASIRSELLFARIALVDPELGLRVPQDVTARSGMDALCQCIESYTSTHSGPDTDSFALQGIALAASALPRAFDDGQDIDARSDMALTALLSGFTLTRAGLGVVHAFASPLGAMLAIPHGTICASLLSPAIGANIAALQAQAADHPSLQKYEAIGRTIAGTNVAAAQAFEQCSLFTADLAQRLGIPRLSTMGLRESMFAAIITAAKNASSMKFNPVKLSDDALLAILNAVL